MVHFSGKFGCSGLPCSRVSSPDYHYHIYPKNTAVCSTETHQRDGFYRIISAGPWWGGLEANQRVIGQRFSCYPHRKTKKGSRLWEDSIFPLFCTAFDKDMLWESLGAFHQDMLLFLDFAVLSLPLHVQFDISPTRENEQAQPFSFPSSTLQKDFLWESLALSHYINKTFFFPIHIPLPLSV